MRLFVALNFNHEVKQQLLQLAQEIQRQSSQGRFTLPENLHLTLVFLGECNSREAAAAREAIASLSFDPLELTINQTGRFKRNDGDIWWAGFQPHPPLQKLQQELVVALREAGFSLEEERYTPHITLGRQVRTTYPPGALATPLHETVTSIQLMKSEQLAGKLTYTAIYSHEKTSN
ncbi:MAG: RNA 2',3'-cyclic phosphodiesterase [Symbiobacteriaceae bacterium]|nr:RNA 2',3'-cyclic phosphodiesterase [Symbiobacteriaceae bacterium]